MTVGVYTGWLHPPALRSMGRNVLLEGHSLEHHHGNNTHDHDLGYLTHRHSRYGNRPSTPTSTWERNPMTATLEIVNVGSEPPDLFDDVTLDAFADAGFPRWVAPLLTISIDPVGRDPEENYEWEIRLGHEYPAVDEMLSVWADTPTADGAAVVSDRIVEMLRALAVS